MAKNKGFSRITQMETNDEIDWVIMLLESRYCNSSSSNHFYFVQIEIIAVTAFAACQCTLGVKVRNMKMILTLEALGGGSGNEH